MLYSTLFIQGSPNKPVGWISEDIGQIVDLSETRNMADRQFHKKMHGEWTHGFSRRSIFLHISIVGHVD